MGEDDDNGVGEGEGGAGPREVRMEGGAVSIEEQNILVANIATATIRASTMDFTH